METHAGLANSLAIPNFFTGWSTVFDLRPPFFGCSWFVSGVPGFGTGPVSLASAFVASDCDGKTVFVLGTLVLVSC